MAQLGDRPAVDRLDPIGEADRAAWAARAGDARAHTDAASSMAALRQIEVGGTPRRAVEGDTLTVVAWNLERGTHIDAASDLLRPMSVDVVLASELDLGMARSGNRHTPAVLAAALEHRYAFAVEFVELGLGDAREVAGLHDGARNASGFHGNAITASGDLDDPLLIRIEADGSWFHAETDQPRVGGRMALAARAQLGATDVVVCSVHLESESDPELRATQMDTVLRALDGHYGHVPTVIGGDLNTFSTSQRDARTRFTELREREPDRFVWPAAHEPLFALAAARGYELDAANERVQTMRRSADQRPGSLLRLDWLLVRGLEVRGRSTLPALGPDGTVLSDHDAVVTTLGPSS